MKSVLHEALRELFARRPDVLPEQLAPLLLARIDLPAPRLVAIDSELTDPRMPQLLPDAVLACPNGKRPRLVIVVEVHLAIEKMKRRVWPQYTAGVHGRWGCPVLLVVVTPSARVERWASAAIHVGPGHTMTPVVLGPAAIPMLDPGEIERAPVFGMLSTLAHMRDPGCADQALRTLDALGSWRDDPDGRLADILLAALSAVVRKRMEELMRTGKFEFHSDVAKKWFEKGREQGLEKGLEQGLEKGREQGLEQGREEGQRRALLTILRSRDIGVPRAAARRIAAERDPERLDAWIARAISARFIADVFADD